MSIIQQIIKNSVRNVHRVIGGKVPEMHEGDVSFCVGVVEKLARRSRATRAQVGAVVFHRGSRSIIGMGYNGTAAGEDNTMEVQGKTLPTVIHAEENAVVGVRRWDAVSSVMVVTHAPCLSCAQTIIRWGIPTVYYLHNYGDGQGLMRLREAGVSVIRIFVP